MRLFTVFMTAVSLTIGLATAGSAQARTIRDTEIENTLRVYAKPIFDAAGLDINNVKLHLVNDQRLNAFVSGGQQMFINTGLLMEADNAEQVMGVMAHETGHITGGHLSQFDEGLRNAQARSIAALLLSIPIAIASGNGQAVIAGRAAADQIGTRSFLKFTRGMEQAADQSAVQFLDDAGISAEGMLEFFDKLKANEALYSADQNPYTRSHPLTNDRVAFVSHHVQTSRFSENKLDPVFDQLHERMKAKLIGYLKSDQVTRYYPESDQSVPARYARTYALMVQHKTDEALDLIDGLIQESPKDPFFIEVKGDVLFHAGRVEESIPYYEQALEILDWAALIRQAAARSHIESAARSGDQAAIDAHMTAAVDHLKKAINYEPDSVFSWNLLGNAYYQLGDEANSTLARAESAIRSRKNPEARSFSKKAMELLPKGSPGWLRAQDIEFEANKGEAEDKQAKEG